MIHKSNNAQNKIFTIPNALSVFRICLIPLIVWLYVISNNSFLAGYVLILSGITDIADGFIARHFHMTSNLGKVLDPIADKLTQAVMLICLIIRFPLMIYPFLLMLAKEMYMGVSGYLVIQKTGIVLGAEWHGKVATIFLYIMMIAHVFLSEIPVYISTMMIVACIVTITVSFVLYGIRNTKISKQN